MNDTSAPFQTLTKLEREPIGGGEGGGGVIIIATCSFTEEKFSTWKKILSVISLLLNRASAHNNSKHFLYNGPLSVLM